MSQWVLHRARLNTRSTNTIQKYSTCQNILIKCCPYYYLTQAFFSWMIGAPKVWKVVMLWLPGKQLSLTVQVQHDPTWENIHLRVLVSMTQVHHLHSKQAGNPIHCLPTNLCSPCKATVNHFPRREKSYTKVGIGLYFKHQCVRNVLYINR